MMALLATLVHRTSVTSASLPLPPTSRAFVDALIYEGENEEEWMRYVAALEALGFHYRSFGSVDEQALSQVRWRLPGHQTRFKKHLEKYY